MKRSLALILAVCCLFSQIVIVNAATATAYVDTVAFEEDFEDYGSSEANYADVAVDPDDATNHAMKIVWTSRSPWKSFSFASAIPAGASYSVTMKLWTSAPAATGRHFIAQVINGSAEVVPMYGHAVDDSQGGVNYALELFNNKGYHINDEDAYTNETFNTVRYDVDATNNTVTSYFNGTQMASKTYSEIGVAENIFESGSTAIRFCGYAVTSEYTLYVDDIKITYKNPVTFDTDDLTLTSSVDAKVEYKDSESKRIIKAEGTTSHYLDQKAYLKALTVSGTTAKDKTFDKAVAKAQTGATYSFSEELPETVGGEWYDVTVTTDYLDSSKEITERIYIATLAERQNLPTDFSSLPQKTLDEAKTIINGYVPVLLGKDSIPEAELEFVAQYFQGITTPFPAGADGIAAVQAAYDASTLYYNISQATVDTLLPILSAADGNRFMSVYEDENGTLDPVLSANATEFMNHFIAKRTEAALLSDSDVAGALRYACAMTKLNNALRSEIQGIVGAYNDIFLLDTTSDDALSVDQNELYGALYSKNYTDATTIATDFDAKVTQLVNELAEEGNNPPPPPPSGGGGGGGSYWTPAVVEPPKEEETVEPTVEEPSKEEETVEPPVAEPSEEEEPAQDVVFTDVSEHWAKDYIEALKKDGIISGFEDGSFQPNKIITRAEFVSMLMRAKPAEAGEATIVFNDVSADDWYYKSVLDAAEAGIVVGTDGNFMPNNAVTREQLAVMIYRALGAKGETTELAFADSDSVADYAKEAISYLAGAGIISGYEDNTIRAKKETTRAEVARLLYVLISETAEK